MEDALIKRVMVTPEEVITRTLDPDSATGSRDALAKTIYSRLFDWYKKKLSLFRLSDSYVLFVFCFHFVHSSIEDMFHLLCQYKSLMHQKYVREMSTISLYIYFS